MNGDAKVLFDNRAYFDFEAAATAVLSFLRQRLGFDLWMVTRTEGDDWIVLQAEDHGYDVKQGNVFRWADSFCSQMVLGKGPRIAPCSASVPAYANAPINKQLAIGAYVGVPLARADGQLFGTLCAIHPTPQPDHLLAQQSLVELLASLLSSLLEADLRQAHQCRRAERAEAEALTDTLTGLYNRRGWEQLSSAEEQRCRRYGHPACVMSIDLDGLKHLNDTVGQAGGDELIRKAGVAIRGAIRKQDIVARLGGDEFAVLGIECDASGASTLRNRVGESLAEASIHASVGLASRHPSRGLIHALETADRAMYVSKNLRRSERFAYR